MRVDKDHTLRSNQEQPIPKQNCHIFSHGPYTFVPASQWTASAFRIRSCTGMKISRHSGKHYSCHLRSELTLGLQSKKTSYFYGTGYILYPYFFNYFLNIFSHCSINRLNWSQNVAYTGCPRRNGQNFGRVFLMLKYTDITQNTYFQSWTVTEIMAIEKCGLLGGPRSLRHPWRHIRPLRMPSNETS